MPFSLTIIDYDAGNLRNVQKAFEFVGVKAKISNLPEDINNSDVLVLPGVGSFRHGIDALKKYRIIDSIRHQVLINSKPILGICLGMQLFAEKGYEGGENEGIGLLPMVVDKLQSDKNGLRIPHMGWNSTEYKDSSKLFKGIDPNPDFYYVHSFHAICKDEELIVATCNYGHKFVSALENKNIFATQFHPEKSQRYGLKLLNNFVEICKCNI